MSSGFRAAGDVLRLGELEKARALLTTDRARAYAVGIRQAEWLVSPA
jgi:hypothetical protein